jgi:hypothetical protein
MSRLVGRSVMWDGRECVGVASPAEKYELKKPDLLPCGERGGELGARKAGRDMVGRVAMSKDVQDGRRIWAAAGWKSYARYESAAIAGQRWSCDRYAGC